MIKLSIWYRFNQSEQLNLNRSTFLLTLASAVFLLIRTSFGCAKSLTRIYPLVSYSNKLVAAGSRWIKQFSRREVRSSAKTLCLKLNTRGLATVVKHLGLMWKGCLNSRLKVGFFVSAIFHLQIYSLNAGIKALVKACRGSFPQYVVKPPSHLNI